MKDYIGIFFGICLLAGWIWVAFFDDGEEYISDDGYTNSSHCDIKGNVSYNTGEKIYHLPTDEYYDETKIDTDYGERWFCSEWEAEEAGFRRSQR